jgi:hypothetical protein
MPRVHTVEKARKADDRYGIKVGDKYYWWTFKNRAGPGTKVKSKTYPKPSQLTRSAFKSQWRSFGEQIAELAIEDGLHDALQSIAADIRSLGEEQQSSLDNMPEGLQQGDTGQMLQERIDACEAWADEIEGLDEPEREEPEHETFEEFLERIPSIPTVDELLTESGQTWAEEQWEEYKGECQEREEEADSEYQSKLEELREEAANADPGEV